MKLGTFVFLGAAGLGSMSLAGALSVGGCGSSSSTADGGSSSGGGSSGSSSGSSSGGSGSGGTTGNPACDDGGLCNTPPAAPTTGTTPAGTTPQNFALHHIHLGDESDSAGNPDWYQYGYNLDGKNTAEASTNVCSLAPNANKKNQIDGPGGIDNSFGANIVVGLLTSIITGPSATIDSTLALGHFTVMFNMTGLTPGVGQSSTGLTGLIFAGVPFNQAPNATTATTVPTWTTADNWPLDSTYVTSPINGTTLTPPVTSKVTFSGAYVANGVVVSGTPTDVTLTLTISGVPLQVPVQHAIITFNHPGATDAGTADTHISGGVIAGVIDAQALVSSLQGVAGNISPALCAGTVFAQLKSSILGTADIMDDGSNQPGTACTGISIGVGFDGDEIGQPAVTGVPSTGTNPCADGGTDGGSEDAAAD